MYIWESDMEKSESMWTYTLIYIYIYITGKQSVGISLTRSSNTEYFAKDDFINLL